ncbi:hypothetical protein GOV11_00715 [Candidatus Woesearchaeota archaeon]|nr:hypothetical protein [Candidatus Woesearchaeota archaeon]
MIKTKEFTEKGSIMEQYVKNVEGFDTKHDLPDLEKKGFLENFNSPGKYYPEMFMITRKCDEFFATNYAASEFWSAYPGTFPLGGGKIFIARSGIDLVEFQEFYLKRIDYSLEVHKKALRSLKIFDKLVNDGILNGKKIIDYVKEAGWDSLPEQKEENWGKDV